MGAFWDSLNLDATKSDEKSGGNVEKGAAMEIEDGFFGSGCTFFKFNRIFNC